MVAFVQPLVALLVGFHVTCTVILICQILSSSEERGLYIPGKFDSFEGVLIFLEITLGKLWVPVCSQRFLTCAILSNAVWLSKNVFKPHHLLLYSSFFCQIITNTKGEFWAHLGLIQLFYLILSHEAFGKKNTDPGSLFQKIDYVNLRWKVLAELLAIRFLKWSLLEVFVQTLGL